MPKLTGRLKNWLRVHSLSITIMFMILLFFVIYLSPSIFIVIEAGYAGALWKRFFGGTVVDKTYPEGLNVIFPWDKMAIYNLRLQQASHTFDVLSSDGLKVDVEIAIRYRPEGQHLGLLHKEVGPNYVETLLLPEIGSKARKEMALYTPEEIYTSKRAHIQSKILTDLKKELQVVYKRDGFPENFIHVEDVLIKSIALPQKVKAAIEAKVEQRHIMLQYQYRLERERLESQRKAIEAQGIRKFQDTIKGGISEPYLRWKGIDATLALARSPNSKVVIIGAGDEGLPLILGNMEGSPPVGLAAEKPTQDVSQPNAGSADESLGDTLSSMPHGGVLAATPEDQPPAVLR